MALHWAAAEAALRGVALVIATVSSSRIAGFQGDRPAPLRVLLREGSGQIVADGEAAVRATFPDLTITTVARSGQVLPLLLDEARGKELAVVGSRGLGGFTGLLLGSIGMGLTAHAHCAVAVIRGDAPLPAVGSPAPIVVGVDGSHESDGALLAALVEARRRRCPLRVVHCWQDPSTDLFTLDAEGHISLPEFDQEAWRSYTATTLATALAGRLAGFPDVAVETAVDWRRTTVALLDRAKGAQLLVVGSRGRGAFRGVVMGSTSRVMIQHAPCPVLVVRGSGDPLTYRDATR